MTKEVFEIVFHARSGQGSKTAAQFLAESALSEGKEVQAFANFGAERAGAPMQTFTRISSKEIRTHEPVLQADLAVVLDETLIGSINVCGILKKNGWLMINSRRKAEEIKKQLKCSQKVKVIDATGISLNITGKGFPNMPLLGAISKLTNIVKIKSIEESIKKKYLGKLGKEMTLKNIESLKKGFEVME
ncbi:MAG: 2-oxoacid:acceptor oxidoreductase family protein [archaeon]